MDKKELYADKISELEAYLEYLQEERRRGYTGPAQDWNQTITNEIDVNSEVLDAVRKLAEIEKCPDKAK